MLAQPGGRYLQHPKTWKRHSDSLRVESRGGPGREAGPLGKKQEMRHWPSCDSGCRPAQAQARGRARTRDRDRARAPFSSCTRTISDSIPSLQQESVAARIRAPSPQTEPRTLRSCITCGHDGSAAPGTVTARRLEGSRPSSWTSSESGRSLARRVGRPTRESFSWPGVTVTPRANVSS